MKKEFWLIIACSIIVWAYYIFLGTIVGADSYYYLNIVCGISPNTDPNILFTGLLNTIPCSIILIKTIYLGLWLITLGIFYKIGELFNKELAWWFPAILFAFTFAITEFWKFENDAFGYTLFFAGLYFVLKLCLNKKWLDTKIIKNKTFWIGLGLILLSGLFWKGSIYWLYSIGFLNILFIPIILILFFLNFDQTFWFLNANQEVYEHIPLLSIIFFGVSIFFIYGVLKNNKKVNAMLVFLLIPALWVTKFFILPIHLLVVTAYNGLTILNKDQIVNQTLLIFVILMTFFWCMNLGYQYPQQQDIDLINYAIELDININNTFGVGYNIINQGGTPSSFGGYKGEPEKKGIVIDVSDRNVPKNCVLIKKTRYLLLEECK